MKQVLIRVNDTELKVLDDIAKDRGCSRADLLRTIINSFIEAGGELKNIDVLEKNNGQLAVMIQALESKNAAVISAYQAQIDTLSASRRETAELNSERIAMLQNEIDRLKNELTEKEGSLAGIRQYIERIKASWAFRFFIQPI